MAFCFQCGTAVSSDDRFCGNCGITLPQAGQGASTAAEARAAGAGASASFGADSESAPVSEPDAGAAREGAHAGPRAGTTGEVSAPSADTPAGDLQPTLVGASADDGTAARPALESESPA